MKREIPLLRLVSCKFIYFLFLLERHDLVLVPGCKFLDVLLIERP